MKMTFLLFCVIILNDTRFFSTSFAVHCCLVWCVGVPQSFLRSITNVISKPLLKFSLSQLHMYVCSIDTCTYMYTGAHVPVLELCWSLHVHVISHVGKMRRELKLETIKNVILVEIRICYRSAFNFKYLYIDSLNKYK